MADYEGKRQIPKTQEYFSSSLYWDILYGYIQVNSCWDGDKEHPRVFPKEKVNFSTIGKDLNLSRQTVANRFKDLGEGRNEKPGLGLIKKMADGGYEITMLEASVATLVENGVLRVLTSACNNHTISIYVYLYSRWKASGGEGFTFTYSQLKKIIGVGNKSTSNNYIIRDILNILILIGLLELKMESGLTADGGYQDIYKVAGMREQLLDPIAAIGKVKQNT